MTIRVQLEAKLTVVETFTGPFVSPGDATATFSELNQSETLTASTSVPVTKWAGYELTLSGGTDTINLASLPGITAEETVVGTGLKVQAILYRNKSTNANKITLTKGGSSGYGFCASGDSWTDVLSPGQYTLKGNEEAAPDIAGGARNIDVTGTVGQILQIILALG